jgi:hypothetical protein
MFAEISTFKVRNNLRQPNRIGLVHEFDKIIIGEGNKWRGLVVGGNWSRGRKIN